MEGNKKIIGRVDFLLKKAMPSLSSRSLVSATEKRKGIAAYTKNGLRTNKLEH